MEVAVISRAIGVAPWYQRQHPVKRPGCEHVQHHTAKVTGAGGQRQQGERRQAPCVHDQRGEKIRVFSFIDECDSALLSKHRQPYIPQTSSSCKSTDSVGYGARSKMTMREMTSSGRCGRYHRRPKPISSLTCITTTSSNHGKRAALRRTVVRLGSFQSARCRVAVLKRLDRRPDEPAWSSA